MPIPWLLPGEFCPVPNVEANVAPLEGTSRRCNSGRWQHSIRRNWTD